VSIVDARNPIIIDSAIKLWRHYTSGEKPTKGRRLEDEEVDPLDDLLDDCSYKYLEADAMIDYYVANITNNNVTKTYTFDNGTIKAEYK
jgi:hypothetical protein